MQIDKITNGTLLLILLWILAMIDALFVPQPTSFFNVALLASAVWIVSRIGELG